MMKLYGSPPTRSLRVQWLLNELELPYETVKVNMEAGEHRSAAFLALNPVGKIPALVDGDTLMTESAAIPLWLAERDPMQRFIPTNVDERGQMYRWIFFLVTEIEAPLWRSALHEVIYAQARRIPEEVANAERDAREMLAVLERHMADREWLVGNRPSVADFIAAYTLDWARHARLLGDCPALTAFVEKMYRRPRAPMTIDEGFAAMKTAAAAGG